MPVPGMRDRGPEPVKSDPRGLSRVRRPVSDGAWGAPGPAGSGAQGLAVNFPAPCAFVPLSQTPVPPAFWIESEHLRLAFKARGPQPQAPGLPLRSAGWPVSGSELTFSSFLPCHLRACGCAVSSCVRSHPRGRSAPRPFLCGGHPSSPASLGLSGWG